MTATAQRYLEAAILALGELAVADDGPVAAACDAIVKAARADRRVFVFGTGHSHLLAEEVHYRAGGPAFVTPILSATTMLHEGAATGGALERIEGVVTPILDRYGIGAGDVLIVASNSGVNVAPLEATAYAKARGATVIGLCSAPYARAAGNGRETLLERADIILDTGLPPGDAVVALPDSDRRVGPLSTIIGAAVLHAVFAEVAAQLAADGDPAVYVSANMPGAAEHNAALIARFRGRNPHL